MPDDDIISNITQEECKSGVIANTLNYSQELDISGLASHSPMSSVATMAQNEENVLNSVLENACGSSTRWCPSCSKTGRQVKLKLCQINLEEAMYLCPEKKCLYPFAYSDPATCVILRPITQMKQHSKKRKKKCLPVTFAPTQRSKATESSNVLRLPAENVPSANAYSLQPYVKRESTSLDDLLLCDDFNDHPHKRDAQKNERIVTGGVKLTNTLLAEKLSSSSNNTKDVHFGELLTASVTPTKRASRKKKKNSIILSFDHKQEPTLYSDPIKIDAAQETPRTKAKEQDQSPLKVDLEMLSQACEELKSTPASSVAAKGPPHFFFSASKPKPVCPLPPCHVLLPLSHRNLNTASTQAKKSISTSNSIPDDFYYKDIPKKRCSRSKLSRHVTLDPPGRKRVFRLTGQRRTNLRLLRSERSRNRATMTFSQSLYEETSSLASSDKSSELSGLSDLLPDLDALSNCSEFNDFISDLDLYNDVPL